MKLLERNIDCIDRRLVLLAPTGAIPAVFGNVTFDEERRAHYIREMQRLRGHVYVQDGFLTPESLSPDGRHQTPEDERSWHLLMLNKAGGVNACAWYLEHPNTASIDDLRLRSCPLAGSEGWRERLKKAVESELDRARRDSLRYAEVGGWAVSKQSRCTSEGLMLALAAYSLGRCLGGALGVTTAGVRNASSAILRKLGGATLEHDGVGMPAYYDAHYHSQIELLRFDSRRPNSRYLGLIELLRQKLTSVSVYATPAQAEAWGLNAA